MSTASNAGPAAASDSRGARFRFKGKEIEVDFEGRDDFISAQIEHLKPAFERELKRLADENARSAPAGSEGDAAPAAGDESATGGTGTPGSIGLEDFYRRAKSREGRGALQEMVLIFAYFLREQRGKEEFGIENLNACFSLVGVTPPKSLANTMGIMKRTQKFFTSGSRRGQYTLTDKGVAYVKRLVGS
jgi:hypothetical protein